MHPAKAQLERGLPPSCGGMDEFWPGEGDASGKSQEAPLGNPEEGDPSQAEPIYAHTSCLWPTVGRTEALAVCSETIAFRGADSCVRLPDAEGDAAGERQWTRGKSTSLERIEGSRHGSP